MNTRCLFLSLGLLAAVACHADPSDGTDETEDAYRVKPKGTSTLGTLTVDVPDGVREGQSVHTLTLHVAAQAADGSVTRDATYFDANKTSAKLPPGKYCLYVDSRVGNLASLHTRDCGIVIAGGQPTTYPLSTVTTSETQLALLRTQTALQGRVVGVNIEGANEVSGSFDSLNTPVSLAATKSELVAKVDTTATNTWAPVTTTVLKGKATILAMPTDNKVVRVKFGGGPAELPDAIEGGGIQWSWSGAASPFSDFAMPRSAALTDVLSFFTTPGTNIVVEIGGQKHTFSLDTAKDFVAHATRIDVDPVTDTDTFGSVATFSGDVSIKTASGAPLAWTKAGGGTVSSFETGYGVWVWAGTYDIEVAYTANGVSKTYKERVKTL